MKKQRIQLLLLLAVLAVLAGGFFGLKQYNKMQAEKPEEVDDTIMLVDISEKNVIRFAYDYEGETYTFEKEDDIWYYTEDRSLDIIQYRMTSMLSNVAPLQVSDVIENVTDMTQYGLKEPSRVIQYETASQSHIFYVGDYNSLADVYYICAPSGTTVYTVSTQVVNGFNYTLDELVEESSQESS